MRKKLMHSLLIAAMTVITNQRVKAQSIADCIEELMLDYQKLAGMKNNLNQMYSGYNVLTRGYNAVKDVSMHNFELNKSFLDAQLLVSPGVRKYPRSRDIIRNQQTILNEYHAGQRAYGNNLSLTPSEKIFMADVYDHIIQASADNLDGLNRVITDSKTRMTDAERIAAIDHLYQQSVDQLSYLRKFNEQLAKTIRQRRSDQDGRKTVEGLYQ